MLNSWIRLLYVSATNSVGAVGENASEWGWSNCMLPVPGPPKPPPSSSATRRDGRCRCHWRRSNSVPLLATQIDPSGARRNTLRRVEAGIAGNVIAAEVELDDAVVARVGDVHVGCGRDDQFRIDQLVVLGIEPRVRTPRTSALRGCTAGRGCYPYRRSRRTPLAAALTPSM